MAVKSQAKRKIFCYNYIESGPAKSSLLKKKFE